jgi:hypothetical protein
MPLVYWLVVTVAKPLQKLQKVAASINSTIINNNIKECQKVLDDLISSFRADFAEYDHVKVYPLYALANILD